MAKSIVKKPSAAAEKYCPECGQKYKEKVVSQLLECDRCLAKKTES